MESGLAGRFASVKMAVRSGWEERVARSGSKKGAGGWWWWLIAVVAEVERLRQGFAAPDDDEEDVDGRRRSFGR